ncbi:MAG: TetR family transcriptional regulator [Pseudomonadales bacterium]
MPDTKPQPVKKRTRRVQERTEITRAKILEAATRMFSEQGFDGVSVRDIENAAAVQRGLVVYHFGDKDSLWKTVADNTFGRMKEQLEERSDILRDLSERDSLAFIIRFHIRYHSQYPELGRLMSQEAIQDSWRIRYLVDKHIKPAALAMRELVMHVVGLDESAYVHWYYIMVTASNTIFSFAPECDLLFGVDSHEEARVEAHGDMLVSMLLGNGE